MPAKGKHRRPKSARLTRSFAVAGTGGAALALPLLGATGANAAPQTAGAAQASVQNTAVQNVAVQSAPVQSAPVKKAGSATETYTVVAGDSLSAIAADQDIDGGWQPLYAANKKAVGDNPELIHPGLKLKVGAAVKAAADSAGEQKSAPKPAPKPAAQSSGSAEREKAPAAEAPAPKAEQAAATTSGFTAPVAAGVSTQYRTAGSMWSSGYHTGTDFAAASGTPVKAIGAGTVVSAGWSGSYGNEVVIRHADGHYSQYAHMSQLSVSTGQTVSGGTQIGNVGSTGNSTGPHLHFEVRTGPGYGSDVDPVAYLRSHGVSL
ncbi:M23 family metallopeptidase [Streptomyces indicus]|uniref:Murein DD-endopeptidase MepM and murein hydrolase activator NlpD, contain LysM domain n=1 Tax=Streptomyces indicus TaxID=417292 RepID=A0A1G8U717_9ACTN|nr:M23 family metallopeptidase [Streptomyces indicus]SDJ48820.1 Murein DD-endopeptidase MepM and murein hydrolase activator NlpD, contain LysM domain [Streptomyces indicus]